MNKTEYKMLINIHKIRIENINKWNVFECPKYRRLSIYPKDAQLLFQVKEDNLKQQRLPKYIY